MLPLVRWRLANSSLSQSKGSARLAQRLSLNYTLGENKINISQIQKHPKVI